MPHCWTSWTVRRPERFASNQVISPASLPLTVGLCGVKTAVKLPDVNFSIVCNISLITSDSLNYTYNKKRTEQLRWMHESIPGK